MCAEWKREREKDRSEELIDWIRDWSTDYDGYQFGDDRRSQQSYSSQQQQQQQLVAIVAGCWHSSHKQPDQWIKQSWTANAAE